MNDFLRGLFKRGAAEVRAPTSDPQLAQALVERGIAAETAGAPADALRLYREAVAADCGFAPAHMNLGIALQAAGDLTAAVASYEQAIARDPRYAAAHYNLGLSHLLRDDYVRAESSFRAALQYRDEFPEAWVALADALEALGRDEDALAALKTAIAQRDDYSGAVTNASVLLRKMGRPAEAVEYQRRAVEIEPENPFVHRRLAEGLHELGRSSEAEAEYRQALALNPDLLEVQTQLALVLQRLGRKAEAMSVLGDAVARGANTAARQILAQALHGFVLRGGTATARKALLILCTDDNVSMLFLTPSIVGVLTDGDGFALLRKNVRRGEDPFGPVASGVAAFLRDPLLLAALPRMAMADAALEEVLTHLRRWILLRFDATLGVGVLDPAVPAEFTCALARQCFFSNYAYFADEEELRRVAIVRESIEAALRRPVANPRALEPALAVAALYDSLHTLDGSERLLEIPTSKWNEAFYPILQEQLDNRRREREIAARLPAVTAIEDDVSLAVRAQYEQNPYPRWVSVQHPRVETFEDLWRRVCPGRPVRARPRPVPMLVAGCGSGHHPIQTARMFPDADILAVDLSLASLAYASRMTERFGIANITYSQADILKLGELDRRFAVVESAGVLHHLHDPMAGWGVLVGLMEPDGLMKIALYSETARTGIRAAREYLTSLDLPSTPEGVRRARHAILALPDGHPAKGAMKFSDFFSLDECRDLIMHVQEHRFTLPRLADCLNQLGLQFLGFECNTESLDRFRKMFPDADAATDLDAWHRFEIAYPSTFDTMYTFWCCRRAMSA